MQESIRIERAENEQDLDQLSQLYNIVFEGEEVDILARILTRHHPNIDFRQWIVARDYAAGGRIVAGLAAIPWKLNLFGREIKALEQGIVGTLPEYRGRGLMHELNRHFDMELRASGAMLGIIQGIPDFYSRFGFRYAMELENQLTLALDRVPEQATGIPIRPAGDHDIPLLICCDARQLSEQDCCTLRDADIWQYLLHESKETEYGSDIYIVDEQHYFRVQYKGFGKGLIISEMSIGLTPRQLDDILVFLAHRAVKDQKPWLRFNLLSRSALFRQLLERGAVWENLYGWQIKIADRKLFFDTFRPALEQNLPPGVRLKMSRGRQDYILENTKGYNAETTEFAIALPDDLIEPLWLGFRSYTDILRVRPDLETMDDGGPQMLSTIFPGRSCWLNGMY